MKYSLILALAGVALLTACSTEPTERQAPEREELSIEVGTVYTVTRQDSTSIWLYLDKATGGTKTVAVRYRTTLDTIPIGLRMYFIRLPGDRPDALYGKTTITPYAMFIHQVGNVERADREVRYTYNYRPYYFDANYWSDFTIGQPFTVLAQLHESN